MRRKTLARTCSQFLNKTGDIARFTSRFVREMFKPRKEVDEFLTQCYWVGYKPLSLVGITAFIMGLVQSSQVPRRTRRKVRNLKF